MRKSYGFQLRTHSFKNPTIEKIASADARQPSIEMPFSLCLPFLPSFLPSVSWLSLGHTPPQPQGHYTVIAPAWSPTCDAIVVSAHLVACNAPMKSVMKQVGSPATFLPIAYL